MTKNEIELMRGTLKDILRTDSSSAIAGYVDELCDQAAKAINPRWCRHCGVYHDPEVGESCPKTPAPEEHAGWNAAVRAAVKILRSNADGCSPGSTAEQQNWPFVRGST